LLALLLPISEDVTAVQIRQGRDLLRHIARTAGRPPELETAALTEDDRLRWSYHHPDGVRPSVTLALSANGVTTHVLPVSSCEREIVLPLWRFPSPEALKLSASDGWQLVESALAPLRASPGPVSIRSLGAGRYWADIPEGWSPRWYLGDHELGQERTLALAPVAVAVADGVLSLEATSPDRAVRVADHRALAELAEEP